MQGYRAGAVDYLFKPFDPDILRSKVAVFANLYRQKKQIERQALDLQKKEEELFQARKLEAVGRLASGRSRLQQHHDRHYGAEPGAAAGRNLVGDDPQLEEFNEIIKLSERAFALTRQLLTFGRRQISTPKSLNVPEVMEDIRKMLLRLIGEDIELNMPQEACVANIWRIEAISSK